MALALDGHDTGKSNGTNSVALTTGLTTANTAGEVIVLVSVQNAGGTQRTVSSVTSTHLTFTKRKQFTPGSDASLSVEEWVAPYSSNLSTEIITANLSNTTDNAAILAFGVSGVSAAIWDPNANWPSTDSTHVDGSSNPEMINQNTTHADTFVIGLFGSSRNSNWGAGTTTGWISIAHLLQSTGVDWSEVGAEYQIFSAAQSNFAIRTLCGSPANWGMIGDALTSDAGAAAVATQPILVSPFLGIGQ